MLEGRQEIDALPTAESERILTVVDSRVQYAEAIAGNRLRPAGPTR